MSLAAETCQSTHCSARLAYTHCRQLKYHVWKWKADLIAGLPFLELSLVNDTDFDLLVDKFFATDRHSVGKGMVEVIQ